MSICMCVHTYVQCTYMYKCSVCTYVHMYEMSNTCFLCCSGVCWVDMHKLAERVQLEELKKIGLVKGEVDKMMEVRNPLLRSLLRYLCVCTPTYD